jgi:type II secretory pathway predicted ATPase ExeA/tetratricopeptide (TPR) repeat protein
MATTSAESYQSLFRISDPSEIYLTLANKGNLEKIVKGIKEAKKLFLVTGEVGSGKTVLVQRAVCELGSKTRLLSVNRGNFSYEELIDYIGKDLETGFSSETSLQNKKLRVEELLQMWSIQHVVIHIDQSLNFQQAMLEDIFKLVDDKFCDSCFFHLLVTGSSELKDILNQSGLSDAVISDACAVEVDRLTSDEVIAYVDFHLQHLKDRGKNLFSNDAIKQIIFYSKGLPRLINRLCSLGLLTAKLEEKPTVTHEMIEEVLANSLLLGNECGYVASPNEEDGPVSEEFLAEDTSPFATKKMKKQEPSEQAAIESLRDYKESGSRDTHESADIAQKALDSNTATISFSNKTVNILAFVMGMFFSALIGAGMYFFQLANQEVSIKQVVRPGISQSQVEQKLSQKVAVLLKRSEQQFAKQQLMTPEKENAWKTYQEILELVPDHPKALAGITKIKETYVLWARQEIQRENHQQAAYHYRKALEAVPDDQDILQALREINEKQLPVETIDAPVAKIALTEEEKERIQMLLLQAKAQFASKKLMTPVKDSAWSTYKEVLALDPEHQQAILGINKIKDTYLSWAKHEIRKGNKKHAIFLFGKALEISPDDPGVLSDLASIQAITSTSVGPKSEFFKLLKDSKGIDELLDFAGRQIAEKRLTSPKHDSAFTVYQVILDRFPTHEKALAGVNNIKDIYVLWARHEAKKGNHSQAEFFYGKALEVVPADAEIIAALGQAKALGRIKKSLNKTNKK